MAIVSHRVSHPLTTDTLVYAACVLAMGGVAYYFFAPAKTSKPVVDQAKPAGKVSTEPSGCCECRLLTSPQAV